MIAAFLRGLSGTIAMLRKNGTESGLQAHPPKYCVLKSWAGTTSAPAAPLAAFKKCCMRSGRYDGAPQNHYNR
jgi:hypothetical protein